MAAFFAIVRHDPQGPLGLQIQVRNWDSPVMCLFTDDMKTDQPSAMSDLFKFLGVTPIEIAKDIRLNESDNLRYLGLRHVYNRLCSTGTLARPLVRWVDPPGTTCAALLSWNYRTNPGVLPSIRLDGLCSRKIAARKFASCRR